MTRRKDFIRILPQEVCMQIFSEVSGMDGISMMNASEVSRDWNKIVGYQIVQDTYFHAFEDYEQFVMFLRTCKEVLRRNGCGNRVKQLTLIPKRKDTIPFMKAFLDSGIQPSRLRLALYSPNYLGLLKWKYLPKMEEVFKNTDDMNIELESLDNVDSLDVLVCNARCLTLNMMSADGLTEDVTFTSGPKEAPFLEEIAINPLNLMFCRKPVFGTILRHYVAPNLTRFGCAAAVDDATIQHMISKKTRHVMLNCERASLRSTINAASNAGARLESLVVDTPKHSTNSREKSLTETYLSCLSNLKSLKLLTPSITAGAILKMIRATNGNLVSFNVSGWDDVALDELSKDYFDTMLRSCPELRVLEFKKCSWFSDVCLKRLRRAINMRRCDVKLQELNIAKSAIRPDALKYFFSHFPLHLDHLTLSTDQIGGKFEEHLKRRRYVREVHWEDNSNDILSMLNNMEAVFKGLLAPTN